MTDCFLFDDEALQEALRAYRERKNKLSDENPANAELHQVQMMGAANFAHYLRDWLKGEFVHDELTERERQRVGEVSGK